MQLASDDGERIGDVSGTRGLPKHNKKAVTEIGHLHEYAYRCQNTTVSVFCATIALQIRRRPLLKSLKSSTRFSAFEIQLRLLYTAHLINSVKMPLSENFKLYNIKNM